MIGKNWKITLVGVLTIIFVFLGSLCIQDFFKNYYENKNFEQLNFVLQNIQSIESSKPLAKELLFFTNNKRVVATKKYKSNINTRDILDYYKNKLTQENWILEKEEKTVNTSSGEASSYTYFFTKENCILQLIVYLDKEKDINYVIYVFSPL